MTFKYLLLLFLSTVCAAAELRLNVTTVTAHNGLSVFECWQMGSPFYLPNDTSTVGAANVHLGNVSSLDFAAASPRANAGAHNAPTKQWAILLQGLIRVSLPHSNESVLAMPGETGIWFAADTADVSREGHISTFLGPTEPLFLQIPTPDGEVPEHKVLHEGPCTLDDMTGWRRNGPGSIS